MNKIGATWPSELEARTVQDATPECEALIHRLRQQRRDHSLGSWRAKMAQGGRDTTRWLKKKAGLLVPALRWTTGENTSTSTSTAGSLEMLVSFWQRIWHRPVPDDQGERLAHLWERYQPPQAAWPGYQGPLRAVELMQRARAHSKTSAGPDGISPQSLADMPLKFWTLLADRLAHWSRRDTFPTAWREARMTLLPKDELCSPVAEVSRLRPITVFNAAYRVVVGAWTSRPCVQGWLPNVCPDCFHGGIAGRNAWQALRHLEAAWDAESALVSFDLEVLRQSFSETGSWKLGKTWMPY